MGTSSVHEAPPYWIQMLEIIHWSRPGGHASDCGGGKDTADRPPGLDQGKN